MLGTFGVIGVRGRHGLLWWKRLGALKRRVELASIQEIALKGICMHSIRTGSRGESFTRALRGKWVLPRCWIVLRPRAWDDARTATDYSMEPTRAHGDCRLS